MECQDEPIDLSRFLPEWDSTVWPFKSMLLRVVYGLTDDVLPRPKQEAAFILVLLPRTKDLIFLFPIHHFQSLILDS